MNNTVQLDGASQESLVAEIADEFIRQVKDFLKGLDIPEDLKDGSYEIDRDALIENAMINAPAAIGNTPREVSQKDMAEMISKIL